jgi:oxygen-independent coproporphyrinogen-3 oxidase
MTPSALPDGDAAPADGALPASALAELPGRGLGAYVHVPFCASRCGYCDFNTYTAADLGGAPGTSRAAYLNAVAAEIRLARRALAGRFDAVFRAEPSRLSGPRALGTVFVGGGTPTLLTSAELGGLLGRLRDAFGLAPDAEVTTEANPDSVTPASLAALVDAGFTRVSFGMQSAVPHVLAVLDRTHTPGRALEAVGWARDAGFRSVSLDLIYGTPGESLDDWRRTLDAALAAAPDHVSAYSLIVEEGTPLARRVRRGDLPAPDEDLHADLYVAADEALTAAGYGWYEVSNWARPGHACRHNLAYWRGDSWWGFGPGAHSHVGGVRWWNVKHPRAYAERLAAGRSPAAGRETLTASDRRVERVLLELRLRGGLPLDVLTDAERSRVPRFVADGLAAEASGRLTLTRRGRLLADAVIRDLLD